jgi:two-component system, OmpR family, KDP operon response regulator KdpE
LFYFKYWTKILHIQEVKLLSFHSNNMRRTRILIVDDDSEISEILRIRLEHENIDVFSAPDGESALQSVKDNPPDLVILDLLLPKVDGTEVCRRLTTLYTIPVIILSGCHEEEEKLLCLGMGADDYITKPFSLEELVARIKTILRRSQTQKEKLLQHVFLQDGLRIDFIARRVTIYNKEVKLTRNEYNLLQELVINADKTLSYEYLLGKLWGEGYKNAREYLHVYIGHLRSKIEPEQTAHSYISNISGVGYLFSSGKGS